METEVQAKIVQQLKAILADVVATRADVVAARKETSEFLEEMRAGLISFRGEFEHRNW